VTRRSHADRDRRRPLGRKRAGHRRAGNFAAARRGRAQERTHRTLWTRRQDAGRAGLNSLRPPRTGMTCRAAHVSVTDRLTSPSRRHPALLPRRVADHCPRQLRTSPRGCRLPRGEVPLVQAAHSDITVDRQRRLAGELLSEAFSGECPGSAQRVAACNAGDHHEVRIAG